MNESEIPIVSPETSSLATAGRLVRRPTARRKVSPRPKAARRAPAAKRKPVARSRARAPRRAAELQGILRNLASKAAVARGRLVAASGEGARATRQTWRKVSGVSRKAIDRLLLDWKQMDAAKKAQFVAALLTALAAASTPLVRRRLKKR
jgi:hypothetical protein